MASEGRLLGAPSKNRPLNGGIANGQGAVEGLVGDVLGWSGTCSIQPILPGVSVGRGRVSSNPSCPAPLQGACPRLRFGFMAEARVDEPLDSVKLQGAGLQPLRFTGRSVQNRTLNGGFAFA